MISPEMLYAQYSNFQTISVEDNYLIGRIVAESQLRQAESTPSS